MGHSPISNIQHLLYTQFPGNALVHRPVLLEYITGDLIASNAQLDGALEYLGALGAQPLDTAAFEAAAGVGVVVRFCTVILHSFADCRATVPLIPLGVRRVASATDEDRPHSLSLTTSLGAPFQPSSPQGLCSPR